MNKFFLLSFFIVANALAETPETIIVLEAVTPKGKVFSKNVVIIKGESVMVDKEKLSPAEIITQSEYITKIASFKPSETADHCVAGKFRHLFKKEKTLKIEEGCLDSDRYITLKESFRSLKKDRVTE